MLKVRLAWDNQNNAFRDATTKNVLGSSRAGNAAVQVSLLAWMFVFTAVVTSTPAGAQDSANIQFNQSSTSVAVFDFLEITARVKAAASGNPFIDASLSGDFATKGSAGSTHIDGFCDSADGSLFRIRFMPSKAGAYDFHLILKSGSQSEQFAGKFQAVDEHRRGPIRADTSYPWHFVWEGTGEHYFFNGTTAYWLMGWREESTIQYSIDRLARLKVNRMRVAVAGRSSTFYGEPVMIGPRWTYFLEPWPAEHADDFRHPGFDYSHFNVAYWQKFDRMLSYARDKGVIISLVIDMNDSGVHLAAGSGDERRFIRYAAARFGAYSNITWDLGDEWRDSAMRSGLMTQAPCSNNGIPITTSQAAIP